MERKILQPEQLIVPGEYELGNLSILQIYFRVFDSGHGNDLPPAIAIQKNTAGLPYLCLHAPKFEPYKEYNSVLEKYLSENPNAQYFLLDGNHKTVASTLCHVPISVFELKSDSDIVEGKNMVETGKLFNWTIPGETLAEVMEELGDYLYDSRDFQTVSDRVKKLTSNGDLPQYMKKRYHRGK